MSKTPKTIVRQLMSDPQKWDLETATGLVVELLERSEKLLKDNKSLSAELEEKKSDREQDEGEQRYRQSVAASEREQGLGELVDTLRRQNWELRMALMTIRDQGKTDDWGKASAMHGLAVRALKEKDVFV